MTNANDPIPRITRDDEAAGSGNLISGNVERLKALFPKIVTDGKIDFDVLRDLLGDAVEEGEERYGLNWKGKRKARAFALTPSLGTLLPMTEDSVDWDTTQNLMVEGDNLEVLKILRRSYAKKTKVIYIDPPYNTGNDFVYNDDYYDPIKNYLLISGQINESEEIITSKQDLSGRFHTGWLNMIYPRLLVSKDFLQDDGVIIVSIDDAEVENLIKIMGEIFGEENHIATLVWDKNRKNDAKLFSVGHEYMVVFAQSLATLKERETKWREPKEGIQEAKELFENLRAELGDNWDAIRAHFSSFYRSLPKTDIRKPIGRFTKIGPRGPYRDDGDISWPGGKGPKYEVFHPHTKKAVKIPPGGWVYPTLDGLLNAYECGFVTFGPDETTLPRQIRYLFEGDGQVMTSVNFSYAQTATMEFAELMGDRVFDNPKNFRDIARILRYLSSKDGLIMDFFAGSGTTGHAVVFQNAIDNGKRRYILVQLPEILNTENQDQKISANFCDKIGKPRNIAELTKERLRRAGAKIRAEHPDAKIDTGFRVYKLATSNLKPWQPDADDLEASLLDAVDNVLPDRTEEDLLVELLLKTGIDLTLPEEMRSIAGQTVHVLGGGTLVVCLGNVSADSAEVLGQGMADWVQDLNPVQTTIYFKDTGLGADGNRTATKANLSAILRQRLGDRIAKIASI